MSSDLQLNEPDPVACVKAWKAGVNVELDGYCGADGQLVNRDTSIRAMEQHRYRIIPPAPKTHTLAEAQVAYCDGKWVKYGFDPRDLPHAPWFNIISKPRCCVMSGDNWLISDTDPREKSPEWVAGFRGNLSARQKPVPRQVDAPEAVDVWQKGGSVLDSRGLTWDTNDSMIAHRRSEIGKPWTVLEEPPCHA